MKPGGAKPINASIMTGQSLMEESKSGSPGTIARRQTLEHAQAGLVVASDQAMDFEGTGQ